jgi:tetratricopeptide (TPR) repeat protein
VYTRTELDVSFTPAAGEARKALLVEMRQDLATAERVDPRSSEVPLARGYMMEIFELDVAGATVEYRKSAELAPQNPVTAFRLAAGQGYIGEYEASIAGFRHVLALDPLSARGHLYVAIVLSRLGRYAEAEAALRKAIELQPQAAVQHAYLAIVQMLQGHNAEAVASAKQEPDEFWRNYGLAFAHWGNGDRAASDEALQWLIKNDADDAGSQIAQVYAQRGEDDEAFRWLEHALETNDGGLTQIRVSPFLVKYEKDPRYEALARKGGVWTGAAGSAEAPRPPGT